MSDNAKPIPVNKGISTSENMRAGWAAVHPVQLRVTALDFAVQTVARAQGFTTTHVLYTADLYEKYLKDGTLPPRPAQTGAQEVPDGDV